MENAMEIVSPLVPTTVLVNVQRIIPDTVLNQIVTPDVTPRVAMLCVVAIGLDAVPVV